DGGEAQDRGAKAGGGGGLDCRLVGDARAHRLVAEVERGVLVDPLVGGAAAVEAGRAQVDEGARTCAEGGLGGAADGLTGGEGGGRRDRVGDRGAREADEGGAELLGFRRVEGADLGAEGGERCEALGVAGADANALPVGEGGASEVVAHVAAAEDDEGGGV